MRSNSLKTLKNLTNPVTLQCAYCDRNSLPEFSKLLDLLSRYEFYGCLLYTSAVGNDERAVELLERLAQLGDQVKEHHRRDHRDRNLHKLSKLACPVDGCRFIEVLRHAL